MKRKFKRAEVLSISVTVSAPNEMAALVTGQKIAQAAHHGDVRFRRIGKKARTLAVSGISILEDPLCEEEAYEITYALTGKINAERSFFDAFDEFGRNDDTETIPFGDSRNEYITFDFESSGL